MGTVPSGRCTTTMPVEVIDCAIATAAMPGCSRRGRFFIHTSVVPVLATAST